MQGLLLSTFGQQNCQEKANVGPTNECYLAWVVIWGRCPSWEGGVWFRNFHTEILTNLIYMLKKIPFVSQRLQINRLCLFPQSVYFYCRICGSGGVYRGSTPPPLLKKKIWNKANREKRTEIGEILYMWFYVNTVTR